MQMNKRVYCEFSFLKDFLRSCPKHGDDPFDVDPVASWMKLYQLLCTSMTFIDISKIKFAQEALSDELLMKFFKRSQAVLHFCDNAFPFNNLKNALSDMDALHSLYLTSKNKIERAELSKAFGIIVLGKQDINKFEYLFKENTIAIPKGTKFKSWKDIEFPEYINVSNSLIVVDNYLFKSEANTLSLLDILLPEKLDNVFHLSIYTMPTQNQENCKCRDIIRKIRELRRTDLLNVHIVISKVYKADFHDRTIITNNAWIDCGSGFDLFSGERASKRTNIRFAFPFLINSNNHKSWENEAYYYLLKDLSKLEKPGVSHTFETDYWGENIRDNRLISYYSKQF